MANLGSVTAPNIERVRGGRGSGVVVYEKVEVGGREEGRRGKTRHELQGERATRCVG